MISVITYTIDFAIFGRRLRNCGTIHWRTGLALSSALDVFREIKLNFEQSSYLRSMENTKYRNTLAKFRLSSHKLNIEVGRHNNIPRNERKCTLCNLNDIEDEFHFLLKCPLYTTFRRQYIPKYFYTNTNMFKYITLMQSENISTLKNIALFCDKSFKLRDTLL